MGEVPEAKSIIIGKIFDQVQDICKHGSEFSKLTEQRVTRLEKDRALDLKTTTEAINEVKNSVDKVGNKLLWITALFLIMSMMAGVNIWELGKSFIGRII